MKFSQAFLPALAALGFAGQASANCAQGVHVISIRGEGETPNGHGYGMVKSLVDQIKNTIPGSSSVAVNYNNQGTTMESNSAAVHHIKHHIKTYARRCPHTKMVITGYSEGAGITMNTFCGTLNPGWNFTWPLDPKFQKNIAAVVVYGDYTRAAAQPFNRGTCRHSSPWPRQHNQFCHRWTGKLHSYCHADDPACCSTGRIQQAHYSYFKINDAEAALWVRGRYHYSLLHRRSESEPIDDLIDAEIA